MQRLGSSAGDETELRRLSTKKEKEREEAAAADAARPASAGPVGPAAAKTAKLAAAGTVGPITARPGEPVVAAGTAGAATGDAVEQAGQQLPTDSGVSLRAQRAEPAQQ